MPAPSEFLRRFRFHAVPGAAAAVPIDRAAALESEVRPIFALLDDPRAQARSLLEEAERAAEQRRLGSAAEAARLLASARAEAEAERSRVASIRLVLADAEQRDVLAAARRESVRIETVSGERLPALVDELVRRVLATGSTAP